MSEIDNLVMEKFVPLREKMVDTVKEQYAAFLNPLEKLFEGKEYSLAMQVLDNGKIVGQYTFQLNGFRIANTLASVLEPQVKLPFANFILKPYVTVEKKALEKFIANKNAVDNPLPTALSFIPNVVIKFLS